MILAGMVLFLSSVVGVMLWFVRELCKVQAEWEREEMERWQRNGWS